MSRHQTTRRTIRLYAIFTALAASLGIGIALGADPWPGNTGAQTSQQVTSQATATATATGFDQPEIRTGQS